MSSQKHSADLILKEIDLMTKKKKVLENLYAAGEISQPTYKHMETELTKLLTELEGYKRNISEHITRRAATLEKQIKSIEKLLAGLEMRYAAGEVDKETYINQNRAIILGVNTTKQELYIIKSSLSVIHEEKLKIEESTSEDTSLIKERKEATKAPKVDRAFAEKVLAKTPPDRAFRFYADVNQPTDITSDNLVDFSEKIKTIDIKPIEFHMSRKDFELWVKSLGDTELAEWLKQVRETNLTGEDLRNRLYNILKTRCTELLDRTSRFLNN